MRFFRRKVAVSVAAAWLSALHADAATTWRAPDERTFPGWRALMQEYADMADARVSHVCVVVQDDSESSVGPVLLAYFREDHFIQGFGAPAPPYPMDATLAAGMGYIDTRDGVVDTEDEINGSTSLVTRAFAGNILRHCRKAGTQMVLRKRAR